MAQSWRLSLICGLAAIMVVSCSTEYVDKKEDETTLAGGNFWANRGKKSQLFRPLGSVYPVLVNQPQSKRGLYANAMPNRLLWVLQQPSVSQSKRGSLRILPNSLLFASNGKRAQMNLARPNSHLFIQGKRDDEDDGVEPFFAGRGKRDAGDEDEINHAFYAGRGKKQQDGLNEVDDFGLDGYSSFFAGRGR